MGLQEPTSFTLVDDTLQWPAAAAAADAPLEDAAGHGAGGGSAELSPPPSHVSPPPLPAPGPSEQAIDQVAVGFLRAQAVDSLVGKEAARVKKQLLGADCKLVRLSASSLRLPVYFRVPFHF